MIGTRDVIKAAFLELLEEMPYSKITVKKLVEKCGINRNSFYYHFQDIPTLMEEIIRDELDTIVAEYPSVNSILNGLDAITDLCVKRRRLVMHIYHSMKREAFERELMKTCEYFVQSYVMNVITQENINDVIQMNCSELVNYYKCLCFGMLIDWLDCGMKEEKARSLRHILKRKAAAAKDIAAALREQEE